MSSAPGMAAAVARPPETWTIGSASPWITSVGTRSARRRAERLGWVSDRQHLAQRAAGV